MPLGPTQNYLARYNSYQLPGYVQQESMESSMNIADHYAPFADSSNSEYTGLQNKIIGLTLKVWEQDFQTCSAQIQLAATMVRSNRSGFAPLYVQYTDRYYNALTQSIKKENTAGRSVRVQDYQVQFEAMPWLISTSGYTITGTGTIDTDQKGRTIADGGWTPTLITVTGTNVTISGYTATGDFAGFVSVSGAVSSLIIDSDAFTATVGGVNKNNVMKWAEYRTYVGPGKTYFAITGASSCSISYNNRWYI
jgi:hypothetical protein